MTDAEISRRLALAIGWEPRKVAVKGSTTVWCMEKHDGVGHGWRRFDYRDPAVIWPIAERYECFPWRWEWDYPNWCARTMEAKKRTIADTAAKAVALAVIGVQA